MRLKACFQYLIVVCVVMTIYSAVLLHLSKSVKTSNQNAGGPPLTHVGGTRSDASDFPATGSEGKTLDQPSPPCRCTPESAEGFEKGSHVAMGLSFPYRYFNSNHWFHISEYYVSRHSHVAPKLPQEATVYIVAPHKLFVANLLPMTFFLLLLAFTDGTARTAEVLPRDALMRQVPGVRPGEFAWVLDTSEVESYVYDSSLPAFKRTRRYISGERESQQKVSSASSHSHRSLTSTSPGVHVSVQDAPEREKIPTKRSAATPDSGRNDVDQGKRRPSGQDADMALIPCDDHDEEHLDLPIWGDGEEDDQDWDWKRWRQRLRSKTPPLPQAQVVDRVSREAQQTADKRNRSDRTNRGYRQPDEASPSLLSNRNNPPSGRRDEGANSNVAAIDGTSGDSSEDYRHKDSLSDVERQQVGESAVDRNIPSYIQPCRSVGDGRVRCTKRKLVEDNTIAAESGAASPGETSSGSSGVDITGDGAVAGAAAGSGPESLPSSLAPPESSEVKSCECAKFIGEFGSAPVERGYWFKGETVENARVRIDALCGNVYQLRQEGRTVVTGMEKEEGGGKEQEEEEEEGDTGGNAAPAGGTRRKRLVIYQRDADRRLLDLEGNVRALRDILGQQWQIVAIVHDNHHEPCWLYSQLMDADMLLTPHGFQSMLLLFLPRGATILEVFPYKYWKEGYAPLAAEWGVQHQHIMSRPVTFMKGLALFFIPLDRCMRSIECRKWSRSADVRLEEHHLKQIAKAARAASREKKEFLPARPPVELDHDSYRR